MQQEIEKSNFKLTVKVPASIDYEMIDDALANVWQSCSYWCHDIQTMNDVKFDDFTNPDWNLKFYTDEGDYYLNMSKIEKNISKFVEFSNGRHFRDMLNGNGDAITTDVFIQCVVLGEVVYG